MTDKKMNTSVCSFVPTSFGFRGVPVSTFAYGNPLRMVNMTFDPVRGVLSVQTTLGIVQCVLRYYPQEEVAPLCDAVASAIDSGVQVCLARVSEADVRWFVGFVLASERPVEVPAAAKRPWANWTQ